MWIEQLLHEPLVLIFIILFFGSLLGRLSIKGISLGTSAVLFVAMFFGHFGYEVSSVVQNLGLSLFIVAVGLQAGPRFFRMMRTTGVVFGIIGLITIVIAAVTTVAMAKLTGISPALSVGIMTGALTSTPGLAAALDATGDPLASVGYGIAYPFGVLAVVLFVQLFPKLLKVDLMKDLHKKTGPVRHKGSPEAMTIEVTRDELHKRTLKEIGIGKGTSAVISRVIRGDRNIISLSDTVILKGDRLVAVGLPEDLRKVRDQAGREVEPAYENPDHIGLRRVTVDSEEIVGKSLRELALRRNYGVTVTRIERGGFEFNQQPGWRLENGDILTIVSSSDRIDEVEKLFSRRPLQVTNVHIFSLSLILLIGVLAGMIPIYIPALGSITLGVAGGPLFVALIIGHFGRLGPIRARFFQPSNQVIRDIGLVLFLAGAGTTAGDGLVEVVAEEGLRLLGAGAVITIVPLVVGFLVAKKLFHLSMVHSLGALCGGMTSTPGLGALNQIVNSEDPSIAYAAAYPFALIFVAVVSQLLVFFL
ncbi:aspartate:alanine exchanger family transporter [Salisediminibacterium halotolerans]|uniref:Transport protein n=1 Tax=Salisediminibacterium halotolerans TaxID=517425 RepID=A0A1H9UJZ9_9BACI|nr:aspartate:alanine exchanger family transporter [Salisediminibacterium haloalkalitolerans]SES09353.1 putative transport protein [Salisediminibacterium haloalkalitolerans]